MQVTESSQLEVFGFKDSKNQIYVAGLTVSDLADRQEFLVDLRNLPVTKLKNDEVLDSKTKLAGSCFAEEGLQIEPDSKHKTINVTATFKSPFYYPHEKHQNGVSQTNGEGDLSAWIADCHCASLTDEASGNCFAERLGNNIVGKLNADQNSKVTAANKYTLTEEARYRISREVGMPVGVSDVLLHRDRGLARSGHQSRYFGQRLNPGDLLCFHSSTHAASYERRWNLKIFNTSEPAAPACLDWMSLLRNTTSFSGVEAQTDSLTTGIDAFGQLYGMPPDPYFSEGEFRGKVIDASGTMMVSPDLITMGKAPYWSSMIFTDNSEYLVPTAVSRDVRCEERRGSDSQVAPKSCTEDTPKSQKPYRRGSFLVLFGDLRLMAFVRTEIANESPCGKFTFSADEHLHKYFRCLKDKWIKDSGIRGRDNWLKEVVLANNVRPFVAFNVLEDNRPVRVRAGTTLLTLIDKRLQLSAQVFQIRSDGSDHNTRQVVPSLQETVLIERAIRGLDYERRIGVETVPVGLDSARRVEDLLIPLNSGDRITWQDYDE